jgi:hypothetical protein
VAQQNKSIISFPFKGIIWKLSLDISEKLLVLELRNEEDRSVNFAGVDLIKKSLVWQDVKVETSWWTGLEEAAEGRVYLHNYKDPQNPEHEGIIVLNGRNGKEIWRDSGKTFLALSEGYIVASEGNDDNRKYYKLDSKTGKPAGELDTKGLFKARSTKARQSENLLNSFHFSFENAHFSKIAGFVKQIMDAEPVQALDYLEYGEQVIISFYLYTPEGLMNYLLVIDEEGAVKYKECIGTRLKGIAMDTFFIFEDLLIFVKEKKELVIFTM